MDSKYLVIKADTLQDAKTRLYNLMIGLGFSDYNYQYIVGEVNYGKVGDRIIKNNTVLSESENGFHIFEFDYNIVEAFESQILPVISENVDLFWCTNDETLQYQNSEVL